MKTAPPIFLSAALASCAPLLEQSYGTSVQYGSECGQLNCRASRLLRTVRPLREGDFIEGVRFGSSVPYLGWSVTRITDFGVELKPSETSDERVMVPYGRQETVESRPGSGYYYFGSSIEFERGPSPGTAVVTILER